MNDKPTKIPPPITLEGAPVPPGHPRVRMTYEQIALMKAAEWFDAYAESHERQPGKEGHAKRNRQRAMFCRLVAAPSDNVSIQVHTETGSLCGVSRLTGDLMWGPVE